MIDIELGSSIGFSAQRRFDIAYRDGVWARGNQQK